MEVRQLEYFIAVAEEQNFTRAAARAHVAQPAVSAQIQRLERELGQPLLDRSHRSVTLTEAGRAALPHARAALAALADVRTAVDEVAQLVHGVVAIGTVTSHDVDMPGLLAEFHAAHPGVEITLTTDNSDALVDRLRTGSLNLAIISIGPTERPAELEFDVITDEAIDAAVCHADPLARRSRIDLEALAQRPLISLPVGTGIRAELDRAFAAAGLTPRVAFEASTPAALADLAERGLGVAIVPRSVAHGRRNLHSLTVTPQLRARLVFACRSTGPMSPATSALLVMARRHLRNTQVRRQP